MHPGFLKDEDLELLKEIDPVVSFDFIQDPKVIREVINLPYGPEDYVNQYKIMVDAGLKVVPTCFWVLERKTRDPPGLGRAPA